MYTNLGSRIGFVQVRLMETTFMYTNLGSRDGCIVYKP